MSACAESGWQRAWESAAALATLVAQSGAAESVGNHRLDVDRRMWCKKPVFWPSVSLAISVANPSKELGGLDCVDSADRDCEHAARQGRANMHVRMCRLLRFDAAQVTAALSARVSQIVSDRQGYREVVAELSRLPARQRDALYLRLLEERSLSEIAEQMEDTEQTAASLIKRGLATLRERLDSERPQIKRRNAARVDVALLHYLRLSDRGQAPAIDAFLARKPGLREDLAPMLEWLHRVMISLRRSKRERAIPYCARSWART